ncbi:MAG: inositol monophosphatase [Clostridiales bacterium]|nr:inositol monophosphatase [Clostridiales bacterium]
MLEKIKYAVKEAGKLILSDDASEIYIKEGHANLVTQRDIAVQEYIINALSEILPGSHFFAEEKSDNELTDEYTWIIDPIDGTLNFIHDRRCSSISVALAKDKEVIIGVIYDPYKDELYYAEKGRGAWCNGKGIHVANTEYKYAVISFGTSPYRSDLTEKSMEIAKKFMLSCADIRRIGSAAIEFCDLASGRTDGFFELELSPWDYAAGFLIASEAGAIVSNPGCEKVSYDRPHCTVAAIPGCFEGVYNTVAEIYLK